MKRILKNIARGMLPAPLLAELREHRKVRSLIKESTFNGDGLLSNHVADFLTEPRFIKAYERGASTGSWGGMDIRWRAYVACWVGSRAAQLEGDFVECGVNRGGLSRTVIEYINFEKLDKKFWLLDTYCGIPEEFYSTASSIHIGGYGECYEAAIHTFRDFPNIKIVRGIVPNTLPIVTAQKIAYLSLDMNVAEPEIAAAEFFWPKLSSGAIILLDDYAYGESYVMQRRAFDVFANQKGTTVLTLPTGQGLLFKP